MLSVFLKSKLHHATVTGAELRYQGSLTLDEDLMDAAGFLEYEKILVSNLNNGNRFETYIIAGARGSKVCCLNGATAHKGTIGDKIIIFTFCFLENSEIKTHKPTVVVLDDNNGIIRSSRV